MDTPENIWFLMARSLSGEATQEQQEELMQLLQQNPQWMQQYDMMRSLWKPVTDKQESDEDPARIRQILQLSAEEAGETPVIPMLRRRVWLKGIAAAAIIAALTMTITFFLNNNSSPGPAKQEVVAQKGSKTRTLLPD